MKKIEFPNLKINNIATEHVVTSISLLTLNQHMNWKSQDILSNKIARAFSILNRLKHFIYNVLLDILLFQLWYMSI